MDHLISERDSLFIFAPAFPQNNLIEFSYCENAIIEEKSHKKGRA